MNKQMTDQTVATLIAHIGKHLELLRESINEITAAENEDLPLLGKDTAFRCADGRPFGELLHLRRDHICPNIPIFREPVESPPLAQRSVGADDP